jgi:hypothetical protein
MPDVCMNLWSHVVVRATFSRYIFFDPSELYENGLHPYQYRSYMHSLHLYQYVLSVKVNMDIIYAT